MSMLEQAAQADRLLGQHINAAPQGWQCPLCKRIWNPSVQYCLNHNGVSLGGVAAGLGNKGSSRSPFDEPRKNQSQDRG